MRGKDGLELRVAGLVTPQPRSLHQQVEAADRFGKKRDFTRARGMEAETWMLALDDSIVDN